MKGLKTFYLDTEVLFLLKGIKNPSALVNSYLRNYFTIPDMKKTELKEKAVEATEMAAILNAKVEEEKAKEPKREYLDEIPA